MKEIEWLYIKYEPMVHQYLYAVCGDSLLVEEITQEVFFQIISRCCSASRFVPERFFQKRIPVKDQICALADQLLHQEILRKEKELPAEFAAALAAEVPALEYLPEVSVMLQAELREVHDKVTHLREPVRKVISLRYYQKMSYKEIAEYFQQSESWVKHKLRSGKTQIERSLEIM